MKVVEFQGNPKARVQPASPVTLTPVNEPDLTPSPDVPLAILKRKLMASNDIVTARKYIREINAHQKVRCEALKTKKATFFSCFSFCLSF